MQTKRRRWILPFSTLIVWIGAFAVLWSYVSVRVSS